MRLITLVDRVFPPSETLFDTTYGQGLHVRCDLRDSVQSSIFYRGVYEPRVTEVFLKELRPGDNVLDLGANVGYFTLLAAHAVGTTGAVHAFEPSYELAERLRADVKQNGFNNVTVHELAVSDSNGSAFLSESSNLTAPAGGRFVTEVATSGRANSIQMVTVDSCLQGMDFDVVKIDIEGAELRAIRGMSATIRRSRPRLMFIEAIEENLVRFGGSIGELEMMMTDLGFEGEVVSEAFFADMIAFRPVA